MGDPATLANLDKMYVADPRGLPDSAPYWLKGGERFFTRPGDFSHRTPSLIEPGKPQTVNLRVGDDLSAAPAAGYTPTVRLDIQAEGLWGRKDILVKFNNKVLEDCEFDGEFLHLPVSAKLVKSGINNIELLVKDATKTGIMLKELQLWITYEQNKQPSVQVSPAASLAPDRQSMLNVRDFGAIGDGRADDTASIQKAIDAAWHTTARGRRRSGGIVYFPPGRYRTTKPIRLRSNLVLTGNEGQYRGNEHGAEINSEADAGLVFWSGDWEEQTIVAETKTGRGRSCGGVVITKLAVKARKFAVHTLGCNSSNLRIENCRFEAGEAAFVSTGHLFFSLFNNIVCQKGLWFLQAQGRFNTSEISNVRVGMHGTRNDDWAIRLEGCIQCISLRNITFERQAKGILLDAKRNGINISVDGVWSYDIEDPDEIVRIKAGNAIMFKNIFATDQPQEFNVVGGNHIVLQGILAKTIDLHGRTSVTTVACPRVVNAGVGAVIDGVKIK